MTATTIRVERSGPAIRAALESSPAERERFECDFQTALTVAAESFDLAPVDAVLDRWRGIAAIRANPLTEAEQEMVARARAGDDSGWLARDPGVGHQPPR
jgi:hypothetical protein